MTLPATCIITLLANGVNPGTPTNNASVPVTVLPLKVDVVNTTPVAEMLPVTETLPAKNALPPRILPPVMLPVAEICPGVDMLPADKLPVVLCDPLVIKLPPVMLPVALTCPAVLTLPPVMLPVALAVPEVIVPVEVTITTSGIPPTLVTALPPDATTETEVVPFAICVTAKLLTAVTLLKKPPSPKINCPVVIFPVAEIEPDVVIFPVVDSLPGVEMLPPEMLAVTRRTLITLLDKLSVCPVIPVPAFKLPPSILPVADTLTPT